MGTTSFTLSEIRCGGTSEDGGDEVIIVWQADAGHPVFFPAGRVPHEMKKDSVWSNIGIRMTFTNDCLITLYDQDVHDDPKLSDYLVSWDYTPDSLPASVTIYNLNGAEYTLSITDVVITK